MFDFMIYVLLPPLMLQSKQKCWLPLDWYIYGEHCYLRPNLCESVTEPTPQPTRHQHSATMQLNKVIIA